MTAFDICPRAVRCSPGRTRAAGVDWTCGLARFLGRWRADPTTWLCATRFTCRSDRRAVRAGPGRSRAGVAWNAGEVGRLLLPDPLCESVLRLLARGGSLLLVQSAFSGIGRRWHVCARVASTQKSLLRSRFRWGRCSQPAPGGLEVSGRQAPQALRLLVALSANSPFDQGRDTCAPPLTPAAEQEFSGPTALGDELFVSATQSRDMCWSVALSVSVPGRRVSRRHGQGQAGVLPGLLFGLGYGGFVDGIVLHEILQWHHMISGAESSETLAGHELIVVAEQFLPRRHLAARHGRFRHDPGVMAPRTPCAHMVVSLQVAGGRVGLLQHP